MTDSFSPVRIGWLLRKDLMEGGRSLAIAAAALTGALVALFGILDLIELARSAFGVGTQAPEAPHGALYRLILFGGGFFVASRALFEAHHRQRAADWFMLPASLIEKYVTRAFLVSIGWAAALSVYFVAMSLISSGMAKVIDGSFEPVFNPFAGTYWLAVTHYLVLQTLFLLGAALFRRAALVKTILGVAGLVIVVIIVAAVLARLFLAQLLQGVFSVMGGGAQSAPSQSGVDRLDSVARSAWTAAQIAYWALIAPALWFFAYRRLSRIQVSD